MTQSEVAGLMDYASVAEVKLQIEKTKANSDAVIQAIITSASRSIDTICNRPDSFRALTGAIARGYAGNGLTVLRIDECVEVTQVEVKDSPTDSTYELWASSDWLTFRGDPRYPDFNRKPYTWLMVDPDGDQVWFTSGLLAGRRGFRPERVGLRGAPTVRVTARWGYSDDTPPTVKQACIIQSARWFKRAQSAWSDTLANFETGQLMYRMPLDPDVELLLVRGRLIVPAVG